jgi:hypothetical protein
MHRFVGHSAYHQEAMNETVWLAQGYMHVCSWKESSMWMMQGSSADGEENESHCMSESLVVMSGLRWLFAFDWRSYA